MPGHPELEQRIRRLSQSYDNAVPPTPGLERRVMARIAIPSGHQPPKPKLRRDFALAGVMVIFVAALAIGITELRAIRHVAKAESAVATPSPIASATATQLPTPPADDLAAAGLTPDLVTPLDVQATDQGRSATLIGGYADPARIVLIVHLDGTPLWLTDMRVADDQGLIDATGSYRANRALGDATYVVENGPHPGVDGLAHLTITVTSRKPGNGPAQIQATWNFSIALPIHAAQQVPAPAPFQLGRWKVNVEVLQVTPVVVNFQALVNGASVPEIGLSTVTLLDPAGNIIGQGCGASITVPKTQIDSPSSPLYHNARVYCQFARPPEGGTYRLRFIGGGGTYTIPIPIKAPPGRGAG
jgi:hypothetical protein